MQRQKADKLLNAFQDFFWKIQGFELNIINGKFTFYKDFPEKKLRILVTTPVVSRNGMYILGSKAIEFSLKHAEKGMILILRDSRAIRGWSDVIGKKIQALEDLINDIRRCSSCHEYHYPHQEKALQVNPKGTHYVLLSCPQCNRNDTSSYRSNRLKTRLHSYLNKNRKV
jgi:RNase P subunit RPR2